MKNNIRHIAISSVLLGSLLVASSAFAAGPAYNWGMMGRSGKTFEKKPDMGIASHTPAIQGNGQPVVGGTVTTVSGSTLIITNKGNVTYTVDASSATTSKKGVAGATLSNIVVGDSVIVQGTVNGSAITASSVIDNGTPPVASSDESKSRGGFMSAIGGFFHNLFGFF